MGGRRPYKRKSALKLQTAGMESCISYKQNLIYRFIDSVVVLRCFGEHREWRCDIRYRQAVCRVVFKLQQDHPRGLVVRASDY